MKNKTHSKTFSATKRVLVMVMFIFFSFVLMGSISAFEWDNKLTYSNNDLRVDLDNWFGFGENYGCAELKSHKSVTQVLEFGFGEEEIVMYYDFNFSELYIDGLGEVYFEDKRTGELLEKDYSFVYWTNETYEKKIYQEECSNKFNGTYTCEDILKGVEILERENWKPYNSKDIIQGNIRIGLKTYVDKRDYIDGVWTIGGKKVEKHATWTAGLNVDLVEYWNFDDGSGSDITGSLDNYTMNSTSSTWTTGILGGAMNFSKTAGEFATTSGLVPEINDSNVSVFGWIKLNRLHEATLSYGFFKIGKNINDGSEEVCQVWTSYAGNINKYSASCPNTITNTAIAVTDGVWKFVGMQWNFNTRNLTIYESGDLIGAVSPADPIILGNFMIAKSIQGTTSDIQQDETGLWSRFLSQAEREQLYNGGTGITFTSLIEIDLNSPVEAFNTTNSSVTFNVTPLSFDGSILINASIILDGVLNQTNLTVINNTPSIFIIDGISDGDHNWTAQVCGDTPECIENLEVRNFTIDSSTPSLVVTSPNQTFGILEIDSNLSLNWNVTDNALSVCSYDWNGTNTTVTCADNQTNINITDGSNKNLTFYVNDTAGNLNSSFVTWDYKVFVNSQTFSETTLEGSTETFSANITKLSSLQISTADLIYNDVFNSGTFTAGDNLNISESLVIPNVDSATNLSFFWSITLSDSSVVNTTSINQTVNPITLDDCSVNTNLFYNYTLVDEEFQTNVSNGSVIELDIDILDFGRTTNILNFSKSYETNPAQVCLNTDILGSTNYSIDSIVRYTATDYANEFYNIRNFTLTNLSIPQNIFLFDLNSTASTDFRMTFKGDDFLVIEGALIFIQRQYISENNTFKTVELPITDSNGQTVAHLVEKDVLYNILVTNGTNGEVLATFNNIIAFCEDATIGDCQINLNALATTTEIFIYNQELKIGITTPEFNQTSRLLSVDFFTFDGSTKTVQLISNKSDILGNTTACDNSLTSSSGTLSCTIPASIGNSSITIFFYVDDVLVFQDFLSLDDLTFGDEGIFILFLIILMLVVMFSDSKSLMLLSIVVGFVSGIGLSLMTGRIIGVSSSIIWLIVVISIALWKLNKGKLN